MDHFPNRLACLSNWLYFFFLAASGYPNRPIEMVIPFPPGGVVEIVERPFKDKVAKILGQPAVISFTAGAGGPITSSERK